MSEADRPTAAAVDDGVSAAPAAPASSLPAPPLAAYCRQCGYALRGLGGDGDGAGRCPECGGAFDLADRRTFARRPPRPRVRWWAWRLSILLVLLAAAAACVPGWYWWQWHNEQKALDTLRQFGAHIEIKRVEPAGLGRWLPGRWAYLRERANLVELRDHTADQVARIDFAALAQLEWLGLSNCHVTDAALARLGGLTRLRGLRLSYNPLDGQGLAHLSACRELKGLFLEGTRLDDAGLANLAGRFPALEMLLIDGTRVTDAGLASLDGRTTLRELDVRGTAVTPAGLRRLAGLTGLRLVRARRIPMTEQEARDLRALMPNVSLEQ